MLPGVVWNLSTQAIPGLYYIYLSITSRKHRLMVTKIILQYEFILKSKFPSLISVSSIRNNHISNTLSQRCPNTYRHTYNYKGSYTLSWVLFLYFLKLLYRFLMWCYICKHESTSLIHIVYEGATRWSTVGHSNCLFFSHYTTLTIYPTLWSSDCILE